MDAKVSKVEVAYARVDTPSLQEVLPIDTHAVVSVAPSYRCSEVDDYRVCAKRIPVTDALAEVVKSLASGHRIVAFESDDAVEVLVCRDVDDEHNLAYYVAPRNSADAIKMVAKVSEDMWRKACGEDDEE